jgi:hypothetical protein
MLGGFLSTFYVLRLGAWQFDAVKDDHRHIEILSPILSPTAVHIVFCFTFTFFLLAFRRGTNSQLNVYPTFDLHCIKQHLQKKRASDKCVIMGLSVRIVSYRVRIVSG